MKAALVVATALSACLWAQDTGTIEGHVLNSVTGLGIPGVAVELHSRDGSYSATTGESGAYRIAGLKFGNYSGSVSKEGYSRSEELQELIAGPRVIGADPVRWDFHMSPKSALHGHVVDAEGRPAPKVRVQLGHEEKITDENGAFTFENLPPGDYTPKAIPEPAVHTQDGVRVETVPTYYPSEVDLGQVQKIQVSGVDSPDYEIRLRTSPVYRVKGVVLDPTGKPAAHVTVRLLRPADQRAKDGLGMTMKGGVMTFVSGPGRPRQEDETESGADGVFEFPSVRPGECRLQVNLPDNYTEVGIKLSGGVSVNVGSRDLEGLEIRLAPPFRLDFSLDFGETQAPPQDNRGLRLPWLAPVDGQPGPDIPGEPRLYEILVPGRYRVLPLEYAVGFYVASVMQGGRDVLGQDIDLTPGSPPLQIVFKAGSGRVRGNVDNGGGATVVLFPEDSPQSMSANVIRAFHCGSSGAFDFPSVPPGDYYAVAFDHIDLLSLSASDLFARVQGAATHVRVEEGSPASLDLRVTPWPR